MKRASLVARPVAFLIDTTFLFCMTLLLLAAGCAGFMVGTGRFAARSGLMGTLLLLFLLFLSIKVFQFLFYFTYLAAHGEKTVDSHGLTPVAPERRRPSPWAFTPGLTHRGPLPGSRRRGNLRASVASIEGVAPRALLVEGATRAPLIGKSILGLKVVRRTDEEAIGYGRSLGGACAYWVSAFPLFLGFAVAIPLKGRTLLTFSPAPW